MGSPAQTTGPGPAAYEINRDLKAGAVKWYPSRGSPTPEHSFDPNKVWREQQAALPIIATRLESTSPVRHVSPRPIYPQPGPGAYSREAPRVYRSVDQVIDDFGVLCTKYSERIQGSPKMRNRSASILRIPSERKELVSIEGVASSSSPLDKTIACVVGKKELKKKDIAARTPTYKGPVYLSSVALPTSPVTKMLKEKIVDYTHRPASPKEIQTINDYHRNGSVTKKQNRPTEAFTQVSPEKSATKSAMLDANKLEPDVVPVSSLAGIATGPSSATVSC